MVIANFVGRNTEKSLENFCFVELGAQCQKIPIAIIW